MAGAVKHADLLSLVVTAQAAGVEPGQYLADILPLIESSTNSSPTTGEIEPSSSVRRTRVALHSFSILFQLWTPVEMPKTGSLPKKGRASLKKWLESTNEEEASYAISSAVALPFLSESRRTALLELVRQHRAGGVWLKAAWAGAKLGYEEDVARLVSAAVDPNHSERAVAYLDELGLTERIPSEAADRDFRAKAEMAVWLAHPMKFGRPPERLAMADRRTIHWPPTRNPRTVYLFKYEYPPAEDSEEPDIGYGMVGSVAFALFGESTEDKTPAEVYALHLGAGRE